MTSGLSAWWRRFWRGPDRSAPAPAPPPAGGGGSAGDGAGDGDPAPTRSPTRRHYHVPPRVDDPQREAHLGAVLQALADGPLTRAALAARVDAGNWGEGRLDAVVDHGLVTGVLRSDDDGATVRARYAD